jgi:hypothetical protein
LAAAAARERDYIKHCGRQTFLASGFAIKTSSIKCTQQLYVRNPNAHNSQPKRDKNVNVVCSPAMMTTKPASGIGLP